MSDVQAPPSHLSAEARDVWRRIHAGWELDDAGRLVLLVACEALDRLRGAQRLLRREGLVTKKGTMHAAVVIERDARLAMLRALRQLNLDVDPLRDRPGRPPGR